MISSDNVGFFRALCFAVPVLKGMETFPRAGPSLHG